MSLRAREKKDLTTTKLFVLVLSEVRQFLRAAHPHALAR